MITAATPRDRAALRGVLVILEQIADRSNDANSRVLAEGAAAELRACVEPSAFDATDGEPSS